MVKTFAKKNFLHMQPVYKICKQSVYTQNIIFQDKMRFDLSSEQWILNTLQKPMLVQLHLNPEKCLAITQK